MAAVATKFALCVVIALIQCTFLDAVVAQESFTRAIKGPVLLPRDQLSVFADETGNEPCTKGKRHCKNWALAAALNQPAPQNSKPEPALSASELANQINNPAAPVRFVQFRNILFPNIPGTDGVTNSFQIQPVIPIHKSKKIPFLQLIKMTLPISSAPGPINQKGLGDMQFFDLVSIKQSWGRWGFGPALVFPTATSKALGAGKWQAGPSFAAIYTGVENLAIGAILQNPISFAGDSSRPAVNNLIITPTFTTTCLLPVSRLLETRLVYRFE